MDLYFACAPDRSDVPAPRVRVELVRGEELVVYEDAREILTWPCRLWRVDAVEGAIRGEPTHRWFRCAALTVVEELPAWLVLGARGDSVVAVMERARQLTEEQVSRLTAIDDTDERRLYQAGWSRWLATGDRTPPVGLGLGLVQSAVEDAARRHDGGLFAWDEVDEVEVLADPAWQQAGHAAVAAALALGAPELFDPSEREVVAHRWTTVIGRGRPG